MWNKNRRGFLFLLLLVITLAAVAVPALPRALSADGPQGLRVAPLNPAFVDYMKNKQRDAMKSGPAAGHVTGGYIPPTVDLSYMEGLRAPAGQKLQRDEAGDLTGSFRWTSDNVTPVKDQGACKTGWAFANTSVMESRVSISGGPASENYSEQSLVCCTDPSWTALAANRCGNGGNDFMAQDTFIKKGARLEACQPYNTGNINSQGCQSCIPAYMTTDFVRVATTDTTPEAIDAIKTAIQTYGPVTVAFFYDVAYLYTDNNTYYYTGSDPQNHIVSIIGWDDAEGVGSGAWLAKNSLGTTWGDSGYFWLCYGKSNATDFGSLRGVKAYDSNEKLYYWDEAGWIRSDGWGDPGDPSGWMANIFTAAPSGNLTHVDFYTGGVGTDYDIRVYKSGDIDSLGTAEVTQTGTCGDAPGYYSIPLDDPVVLSNRQAFTVTVKLTSTGYPYPIAIEEAVAGVCAPPIQDGKSYACWHEGDPWLDVAEKNSQNVCLRARVLATPPVVPIVATGDADITGTGVTLNGTLTDDGGEDCEYIFWYGTSSGDYSDNTSWSGISDNRSTGGSFSAPLPGLTPGTKYYFAAGCKNSAGPGTGPEKSFTTPSFPTVTSDKATSVMATTAILRGNLVSDGGSATTVTIYGGTTDHGTPASPPDGWTLVGNVGVRPEGAFSLGVTGLTDNTTYYYRCYALNSAGPSWSSLNSFHTQKQLGIWRNYWAGPGKDWFWFSSGSP